MKKLLLILGLASVSSWGTTHTASSCSQTDVQAAIDQARDRDTVIIPAGTGTWTFTGKAGFQGVASAICMNRGIALVREGI